MMMLLLQLLLLLPSFDQAFAQAAVLWRLLVLQSRGPPQHHCH